MGGDDEYFVEWKEQYVSKERGHRVVHYFLRDNLGESVLAVVGTERSVRHMFYVVSDEFLNAYGEDNSVHAGFRWRSRREVVNWLTSMLSKHRRQGDYEVSPKDSPTTEVNALQNHMPPHKGCLASLSKGRHLDISWSGTAWTCGKQLKHYPSFRRNGISIAVQSFVFVMAEKESRYIAYLEDMYEDRKCQKKVKVRWFHLNKEVKAVVSLRNPHPKEVFITPYIQVISAECVDGPAIVLTREHFEKCLDVFPNDLLGGVHFCFRQFKSSRVKPFKLSKLRGYFDQPIFSCFSPDFFEDDEFSTEDDAKVGTKRNRSLKEHTKSTQDLSYKKSCLRPVFPPDSKVEFLCQDSGIRGCWFRCTVLEVSRKQIKILYDDLKDEDSRSNLEEWIPTYRVAKADKIGMRKSGRPTVRPACPCDGSSLKTFEVGDPADAWWSDGWWEGVVSGTIDSENGTYQIYIPGENLHLNIEQKDLRVSRDWVGDRWLDIEPNPSIIPAAKTDTKLSESSPVSTETKPDNAVPSLILAAAKEELDELTGTTLTVVPEENDHTDNIVDQVAKVEEKDNNPDSDQNDDDKTKNVDDNEEDNNLIECEISELKCDSETVKC